MVEVFENELISPHRQSSKGNQLKWKTSDDKWYKADYRGYEGLVEYVVSEILKTSTLSEEEFIAYDLEQISYKQGKYGGQRKAGSLKVHHLMGQEMVLDQLVAVFAVKRE